MTKSRNQTISSLASPWINSARIVMSSVLSHKYVDAFGRTSQVFLFPLSPGKGGEGDRTGCTAPTVSFPASMKIAVARLFSSRRKRLVDLARLSDLSPLALPISGKGAKENEKLFAGREL